MARKPKPKNTLSAGQRAAMYEEQRRIAAEREATESTKSSDVEAAKPVGAERAVAKPKPKPKPQGATVKVDLGVHGGKIGALHGMCNGPVCDGGDISDIFVELSVPCVRIGDVGGAIGGYVVDISSIFPDMNADERAPENYVFADTDKHILAAAKTGAKIIYRLGDSLIHGAPEHKLALCGDYNKICTVCVNIIKHYNGGWGKGFALGIKDVEILSHVDIASVTAKNKREDIFELYVRIAGALKLYDDSLRVGGACFGSPSQTVREFLKYAKRANAPIDFLSVAIHSSTPEQMGAQIEKYLHILKNSGYANSDIVVSQWGYLPEIDGVSVSDSLDISCERAEQKKQVFDTRASVRGAAFIASGLIKMLGYPQIRAACLYNGEASSLWCSVCDRFGIKQKPYYAISGYEKLVRAGDSLLCISEQSPQHSHTGIYAASAGNQREAYVMISAFDGVQSIDLRLDNIPDGFFTADIYMLDGVKNLELCSSVQLSGMRKRLVLNTSPYGVILIKLY